MHHRRIPLSDKHLQPTHHLLFSLPVQVQGQTLLNSVYRQLLPVAQVQLILDFFQMDLNCIFSDKKLSGNLPVSSPAGNQS